MKTLPEIRAILRSHAPELRARYHVLDIAVFGSVARGEQTADSDVDILVDFGQPVGWEIVHLRDYLEQILEVKVDLVTRNAFIRKPLLWQAIQEDLAYA